MPNIKIKRAFQIVHRGAHNLIQKRPLAISLEVIHSCNCNCSHCDKGGMIPAEVLAPPKRFGEIVRELRPIIAQISGGEPLLRADIFDIVREVKNWGKLPHVVFVTNAALLTEEKYRQLKELGVDEFSISLDFPDQRHDENRGIPGLYHHLNDLIPKLARHGHRDITLISVIRADSLPFLPELADHALRWDVAINFSSYTALRTGNDSQSIRGPAQLDQLRKQIDYLIQFKRDTGRIFTTESTLNRYFDFFANESNAPVCRAGYRSLVVNPDGRLAPCAMKPVSFGTQAELIDQFSKTNTCGACLVSMRANTEKSIGTLVKDGWQTLLQMQRQSNLIRMTAQ